MPCLMNRLTLLTTLTALLLMGAGSALAIGEDSQFLLKPDRDILNDAGALSDYLSDERTREFIDLRLKLGNLTPAEELELRKLRGVLLIDSGSCTEAIEDLDAALKLNPNDDEALGKRGLAYLCRGERPAAERDFAAAITASPDSIWGHYGRGWMHFRAGASEAAIADLDVVVKARPSWALAYWARGYVRVSTGR